MRIRDNYRSRYNKQNKTLYLVIASIILLCILSLTFIFTNTDIHINTTDEAVEIVWNYHHLNHKLISSPDGILVFCSSDITVADVAARLFWKYHDTNPDLYILFSGGMGTGIHSGANLLGWTQPEAIVFRDRVNKYFDGKDYKDIPIRNILIETKATNSGENVDFSKEILITNNKKYERIILVQKPFMERRAYATMKKRWSYIDGGPEEICVQSIKMECMEYLDKNPVDKEKVISIMVGDLQRCKYYASPYGDFQIVQEIPDHVWNAFEFLVASGYTENLMPKSITDHYDHNHNPLPN